MRNQNDSPSSRRGSEDSDQPGRESSPSQERESSQRWRSQSSPASPDASQRSGVDRGRENQPYAGRGADPLSRGVEQSFDESEDEGGYGGYEYKTNESFGAGQGSNSGRGGMRPQQQPPRGFAGRQPGGYQEPAPGREGGYGQQAHSGYSSEHRDNDSEWVFVDRDFGGSGWERRPRYVHGDDREVMSPNRSHDMGYGGYGGYGGSSNDFAEETGRYGGRQQTQRTAYSGQQSPMARQTDRQGPKGYTRSDDRVKEEICERLWHDHSLHVSEVSVEVKNGHVTLEGSVPQRQMRYAIEEIADRVRGVQDIDNRLRVQRDAGRSSGVEGSTKTARTGMSGAISGAEGSAGTSAAGLSRNSGLTNSTGSGTGISGKGSPSVS